MSLRDQFNEKERKGFIKQIADKLFQGIQTATDKGERRRWIWELVQNAKDAPIAPEIGPVSIKVGCDEHALTFEHNADPFDIDSITGLIQQVSSKDSSPNSDTTGKFGTGFITTHMLSKVVDVEGVLAYDGGAKRFSITLDRQADSPDELVGKVEELLRRKDDISDDTLYPPLSGEDLLRSKASFDTRFTYTLKQGTHRFATEGINDLIQNASLTLLFNQRIGEIRVNDSYQDRHISICRSEQPFSDNAIGVKLFQAMITELQTGTITTETVAWFSNHHSIRLAVPVIVNDRGFITEILALSGKQPVLFKDFPLVGTENWVFALICNCTDFQPTEPRDGLYLHVDEGVEEVSLQIVKNRQLVSDLFLQVTDFIKLLSAQEQPPKGLFRLMKLGLPKKEEHTDVREFLSGLQTEFRSTVREIPIVLTAGGIKPISACRFPVYPSHAAADDLSTAQTFYNLCRKQFGESLPVADEFLQWLEIIQSEPQSWGNEVLLDISELLQFIHAKGSIAALGFSSAEEAVRWLNEVYDFIAMNHESHHFGNLKLVPNQKGIFILSKDAYEEEQRGIPEILKDAGEALGKPYRSLLLNSGIQCKYVTNILTIEDCSRQLNDLIGRQMQRPEQLQTAQLLSVAAICNVVTGTLADNRRLELVKQLSPLIDVWKAEPINISALKGESFEFASSLRAVVRYCLWEISRVGSLNELGKEIGMTEDEAAEWLTRLINLIESHGDVKDLIANYAVFPDQNGELHFAKDLARDVDGIELDLKAIHHSLYPKRDVRADLLYSSFSTQSVVREYKRDDIAREIERELDKRVAEQADASLAMGMIDWLEQPTNKRHERAFPWLVANKSRIIIDSLGESKKGPIFQLIRSGANIQQLNAIAESGQLDVINQIIASGVDLSQIARMQEMIKQLGSISNLEDVVASYIEEKANMDFLKRLGSHVEDIFRTSLDGQAEVFTVVREGFEFGQDFALRFKDGREYRVEVKSFAQGKERVHMSKLQGQTAVIHADDYALCVLGRPEKLEDATQEYFREHARFITDIGHRLKRRVAAAAQIDELIEAQESDEGGVDFDNRAYKFRVGKRIWTSPEAMSFEKFLQRIYPAISS